ncbi:hypothetical protein AMTR_s00076p00191640 [Amborella trichopoda]|uniref:AMP-dependent synthetase/ligase domain-containing protein n=1 Tax=Amborella trichopoda TaxID=13333 RepID=W1PCH3_AMBTC|nr:hypothetical protein AMTR_s00076p00191640 [Amborella trichopoda]
MEVAKQVKDSMEVAKQVKDSMEVAKQVKDSGSRRPARGFILTHGNFIAASLMVASDQDWKGEIHNRFLCVIPMFHMFGLSILTYTHLQRGNAVIIMSRFDLQNFAAEIG